MNQLNDVAFFENAKNLGVAVPVFDPNDTMQKPAAHLKNGELIIHDNGANVACIRIDDAGIENKLKDHCHRKKASIVVVQVNEKGVFTAPWEMDLRCSS